MLGSILGDYLGSKFEKVPKYPQRQECAITDDSWLSFAQLDWLNQLDLSKFSYLLKNHQRYESKDYPLFVNELELQARKYILKWFDIANKYYQNNDGFLPGFSKGMYLWAEKERTKTATREKRKTNTNGCLMRNSPIFSYAKKHNLNLSETIELSLIFAKTTHDSEEAIESVRLHTAFGFLGYSNVINLGNYKSALTSDDYSLLTLKNPIVFSKLNIKPLDFWLEEKKTKGFIWDAVSSLNIAFSAIYFSSSYDEFIDFCCKTEMDTDTYAAIGGDIAAKIFNTELQLDHLMAHIAQYPEVITLLHKN